MIRFSAFSLSLLLLATHSAYGGMHKMLEAIRSSEFRFARSSSEVPFPPVGWLRNSYYPSTDFEEQDGRLPDATMVQNTVSLGGVMPAYIAQRDMLLLGGDFAWDDVQVRSGPYEDQSVLRLVPVAGWMHQFGANDLLGAFVAPVLSWELVANQSVGAGGYGGVIGIHWFSETLQLLYGGVYANSFGQSSGYPYLGCQWLPVPRCSVALVFPWPSVTYALSDRWVLQALVSPGGSSWVSRNEGYETTQSLTSWNCMAGVGYRFYEKFWIFAGAGVTGLRGFEFEDDAGTTNLDPDPGAVFSLSLQFRP